MFKKTAATAVAITFALSLPADALGLGGGLGGRGKGGKSTSSSSSSSKSKSSSSKSKGGVSAGASVGRGGVSVGARAGGLGVGASVGRSGVSAGASVGGAVSSGTSVSRSGVSTSTSVGSAASVGASVSRSGISTSTSVGSLSVGTSVSATGISATVGGVAASGSSAPQQKQQALSIPARTAALLLLPLPSALQPGSEGRSCVEDGGCEAAPAKLQSAQVQEGRASAGSAVQTGISDNIKSGSKLAQKPGTPVSIVTACQLAAARAAKAYGAVSVEAASGGEFTATASGGGIAPVNLRVTYPGSTGSRQARVSCAINSDGVVTGLNV
jgi:hypothetical protein